MILIVVATAFGSILSQPSSIFGPALRAVNDPNFSDIVAQTFKLNVDSSPLETLTNALIPYFENKSLDVGLASDLFSFIKLKTIPEELKPLFFQSYSYLAHYSKERNDISLLEQLFHYFGSRNNNVYSELLKTARHVIDSNTSDLLFLFRIVDLFERTYIDSRTGSDDFSLFLFRKLQNVNLEDVKNLEDNNALGLVTQVKLQNTTMNGEELKKRKWFFSNSVMRSFPELKSHILKACQAGNEPLDAYTLIFFFGKKMTPEEQEPFIKLMLKAEKLNLGGIAMAKQLGWVEEYKQMLEIRLAENRLSPMLEATLVTFYDGRTAGLVRAALDLWLLSIGKNIYEGEEQNLEQVRQEYDAILNQYFDYSDVIRLHVNYLSNAKSEKFASAIRMYLKNGWPLEALEPLFVRVLARLDEYGALGLYILTNEFPNLIKLKAKYLAAVRMLSEIPYKVARMEKKLEEQLTSNPLQSKPLAQVLLHVAILARNGKLEDLTQMEWETMSETYWALPAIVIEKPKLKKIIGRVV